MRKKVVYLVREVDGVNVAYNDSIYLKRKDAEKHYCNAVRLKGYITMLVKVYDVNYNDVVNNGLDTALDTYAFIEVIKQK